MIQGATLDAEFADAQDVASKVNMTAQIAAYVCFSRVRRANRICILQPFAPWLFQHGPPKCPSRLLRLWRKECAAEEILEEWMDDAESDSDDARGDQDKDIMKSKLFCASCYFQGSVPYSHSVQDFGINDRPEMWAKYVSQGAWTRCERCVQRYGPVQCGTQAAISHPSSSQTVRESRGNSVTNAGA